jgi:hypothetical protein
MVKSLVFTLFVIWSQFGLGEVTRPEYNKWAFKIAPLEFRGGNHQLGKPSIYHLAVEMIASERGLNSKYKKDSKLVTIGPIETNSLAWRIPTESEIESDTFEVSGDDFRKSISQAMTETKLSEDQIRVEIKLTAFIKPLIPFFQQPQIIGTTSIFPEDEMRDFTPFQKEIDIGLGGVLKFKVMPTGGPKKK